MRILGIGGDNDLGAMYLRLAAAGHEVRVHVDDPQSHDVLDGMIQRIPDYRAQLEWARDGILVFETTGYGVVQDALRADGYRVVGGSAFGDRLESDRCFGQETFAAHGVRTVPSYPFDSYARAAEFIRREGGRWVLKIDGSGALPTRCHVGALDDGRDLLALLELDAERTGPIVLMAHAAGVEVGVGAFFDGEDFVLPANLDWEHKRFFPGDLGELTGEMGTVATYRGAGPLFEAVLAPLAPAFRAAGHVGYVNVNTIVSERGVTPLEFTCRFGYPGFAVLDALHEDAWDVVLDDLLAGRRRLRTADGYSVAVVLTIAPFPYPRPTMSVPVIFREPLSATEEQHLHFGEVRRVGDKLATAGVLGHVGVATGRGATIEAARHATYSLCRKVVVPGLRYRHDIGERVMREDLPRLERLGVVKAAILQRTRREGGVMPERKTKKRAAKARRAGKSASTQAGEYVREEIHHVREGKHGAKNAKQAIAIGLSKARAEGVKVPKKKGAKATTKKRAHKKSATRSRASKKALKKQGHRATTHRALSRHAKKAAKKRTKKQRSASARKAARTRSHT